MRRPTALFTLALGISAAGLPAAAQDALPRFDAASVHFNISGTTPKNGQQIVPNGVNLRNLQLRVIIRYDVELSYSPQVPAPGAAPGGHAILAPSMFTALQEQLGLKLEAGEEQVEVLVVDRVDPLREN